MNTSSGLTMYSSPIGSNDKSKDVFRAFQDFNSDMSFIYSYLNKKIECVDQDCLKDLKNERTKKP